MKPPINVTPAQSVAHLYPEVWSRVNRLHIRKILCEFAHELIIHPQLQYTSDGWEYYILRADQPDVTYHFRAKILSLDHWYIDTNSIAKYVGEESAPLESLSFIIEFRETMGLSDTVIPVYLEEINSTLCGSAYMHVYNKISAADLAVSDYQVIEQAMMAGHPCFVANNGRIGFDAGEYRQYAPEAADAFALIWLAAHVSRSGYAGVTDLDYNTLITDELGPEVLAAFKQTLTDKGLHPDDYFFIPVHPWQWFNKLAIIFAADIAENQLVYLGYGKDKYLPQQSIRTFYNVTSPHRRYTKTSLSILNMGFMRGLHASFVVTSPPISEWVNGVVEADDYLREKGFVLLQEVAAVGYTNPHYAAIIKDDNSSYNGMLSALWRESPVGKLRPGQRLMTMAALLHVDSFGNALLPALIQASGLTISAWIERYLDCYLSPLLHCYYYHDMRFMPHGENLILILENHMPAGAIMKDIGEEIAVLNEEIPMPDNVKQIYMKVAPELRILSIFTQAFDCFFRFLSHILVEHADFPEEMFWQLVATCIKNYQQSHPQLQDKFDRIDLFAAEITKTCLNRLQIRNNRKMVDLMYNPFKSQQFAGTLKNPMAAYKPQQTPAATLVEEV
ncbi:IucA/IucC family siderophore biosynthesis protein [Chitinophaga pendula]|uniref:IucA/IucC family protein n=1 Tax=Chitinophaga TaxID=79328 RepID=UPI000BAF1D9D|nr:MULTISPECIES: IucA/IucC family siderophore biosynthesis protein [Chitinophaga]ASZ12317.1 IucA/IucC family protein [Chitinophaga sp. MD30]UCJ10090.1 IucA/IucC family siderophore biosynthesis protein [Chitinophaga pendula]